MDQIAPEPVSLSEDTLATQLCASPCGADPVQLSLCVAGEWLEAAVLHQHLIDAAGEESSLVLDFTELTYVDASCFQLLLAAETAGLLAANRVQFAHLPDAVKRCFAYSGAASLLCAEAKVA